MNPIFVALFTVVFSLCGFAQAQADQDVQAGQAPQEFLTLTDYLRAAPAYLSAFITFEKSHRLFHDEVAGREVITASIQPNEEIYVRVDRTSLEIRTEGGLRLLLAGIPIQITELRYNNESRDVEVKSSVLGIDAGDHFVERRVAKEIKGKFLPKLQEAFNRLLKVRQQQTLAQAGDMLNSVINVFKDEPKPGKKPGPPLPTFTGSLSLATDVVYDMTLGFGPVVADLQRGDVLRSTLLVRVPARSKMQVRGIMFNSNHGIVLRDPNTSSRSIAKAILNNFYANEESGLHIQATNGADDLLTGAHVLIALSNLQNVGGLGKIRQSTAVQDFINMKLNSGLGDYVRKHRPQMLKAGATPELLNALERAN